MSEKLNLSDKEFKLIYLGAVVGAMASWIGNFVATAPTPPNLEFLGSFVQILRVVAFFAITWLLSIILTATLDTIGFFKFSNSAGAKPTSKSG